MYEKLKLMFVGASPLIMHSSQTVDPLNKYTRALKEISGKRKKVDADYLEMARIEFLAALYSDEDGDVVLPSENIEACLVGGAKKSKSGIQAKSGLFVEQPTKLIYDGPKTPKELFEDSRFRHTCPAKIGASRVMRTRPIFKKWSAEVEITYLTEVLTERDIRDFAYQAGMLVGIGDWRPKHGRFNVV